MKRYQKSLFIFRRDLRLHDNNGLNVAINASQQVLACFIFDPRQIEKHAYQSQPALQFMLESLADLRQQLADQGGHLYLFNARPEQVIKQLQHEQNIDAVFVNRDYTPFSRQRDHDIYQQCLSLEVDFHSLADVLLNEPEDIVKHDGSPYQVFTAFYNRSRQTPVSLPKPLAEGEFVTDYPLPAQDWIADFSRPHDNQFQGGRSMALGILEEQLSDCGDYLQQRDFPALAATTGLSAYLKFGCCSVREAYYHIRHQLGSEHGLLRQYYWRDFFTHIAYHFPHVFGHAFHRRYDNLKWENDETKFWTWANGLTGFPIVDAGMRELKQTGGMHNRLRMITASFLVKDLHVSWRWGERYFAQHLLDYDPCLNNGNWQWAASTGCDAQPYFRIFNPWLQQQKFDPDCLYIKRWLPELQAYSAKIIHHWQNNPQNCDYPPPMVDHGLQSQRIKAMFKAATINAD